MRELGRNKLDLESSSGAETQTRVAMAWTWQCITFLLLLAFLMASLPEELMKCTAVTHIHRRRGRTLLKHECIYNATAAALGFGTIENIGYIYAASTAETKIMIADDSGWARSHCNELSRTHECLDSHQHNTERQSGHCFAALAHSVCLRRVSRDLRFRLVHVERFGW